MRFLIASPRGGLCNRLLALASSMRLAERSARTLLLDWVPLPDCGARFEKLFQADIRPATRRDLRGAQRVLHHLTPWAERGVDAHKGPDKIAVESYTFFFDRSELADVRREGPLTPESVERGRLSPYLARQRPSRGAGETVDAFARRHALGGRVFPAYRWLAPYLRRLRPRPEIVLAADAFAQRHALADRVGVHARRGDHRRSIMESTDEKFLQRMAALADAEPKTRFFLCTDGASTRAALQEAYAGGADPEALVCRPAPSYDRNAPDAIVDALVDLLLLSRCERILGSCGSTFSVVAALLGDRDFEWVV